MPMMEMTAVTPFLIVLQQAAVKKALPMAMAAHLAIRYLLDKQEYQLQVAVVVAQEPMLREQLEVLVLQVQ
jgi:hypothetical protein